MASQDDRRRSPRGPRRPAGAPREPFRILGAALTAGAILIGIGGSWAAGEEQGNSSDIVPLRILPQRAEVDLVLVDVVVRDRKGNPVPGMRLDDFRLRIDDRPAEISTFEDHCTSPAVRGRRSKEESSGSSSSDDTGTVPAHVVLFFDVGQLSPQGKQRSIAASLAYVRERKGERDQVMIVAMKRRPRVIQSFTSDRELLSSKLSALMADRELVAVDSVEERLNMNEVLDRECMGPGARCWRRLAVAIPYAEEEMHRARRSLESLRNLMPALSALRGRKTLVHFSESLRDEPGLEYLVLAGSTPYAEGIDIRMSVTDLQREANAAGVALYMVWAAALGEKGSLGMADASRRAGAADTVLLEQALMGGEDSALALGSTLALETGGATTQRTSDMGRIFDRVEEDLSCYYVLGYRNEGPGDGRRHSIKVRSGRRGLEMRHRPYYEDWPESERLDRRLASALVAPGYFRRIPIKAEAYLLAPEERTTPILLKAEFPVEAVTLLPQPEGVVYGEALVRAVVWTEGKEACEFERRVPVTARRKEDLSGRFLIYEAGCHLREGEHEFTVAALDVGTWEMGAARALLPVSGRRKGVVGDVVLWTSSAGDILVAEDAAAVGIHTVGARHGFVPRPERRFGVRESGVLYIAICPPDRRSDAEGAEIRVRRRLYSQEAEIASFGDVVIGGGEGLGSGAPGGPSPSREGACEGLFAPVAAGQLDVGEYVLVTEIEGIDEETIVHRAGIAVTEDPSGPPRD